VRRAFLCGKDRYSGQSFEHRRQWIEDRLQQLAEVFAVSLWAYAVMSNHLHVVVQLLPDVATQWTDEEVADRWIRLFPKAEQEAALRVQALLANPERLAVLRSRLCDLSWFMRCLSEPIDRRANAEDHKEPWTPTIPKRALDTHNWGEPWMGEPWTPKIPKFPTRPCAVC